MIINIMITADLGFDNFTPIAEEFQNMCFTDKLSYQVTELLNGFSTAKRYNPFTNSRNSKKNPIRDPTIMIGTGKTIEDKETSLSFASARQARRERLSGYFQFVQLVRFKRMKFTLKRFFCTCYQKNIGRDVCNCCRSDKDKKKPSQEASGDQISTFAVALGIRAIRIRKLRSTRRSRRLALRREKGLLKGVSPMKKAFPTHFQRIDATSADFETLGSSSKP